jgi:hypothetical protein
VIAAVVFELTPSGCDLSTDTTPWQCVGHGGGEFAAGRSVGVANDRSRRDSVSRQKHGAGHLRERQAWRERHGIEQQPPATCFAKLQVFRPLVSYRTPSSSTSKISSAFGGMTPPARGAVAELWRDRQRRLPPTFMPATPSSHPLIT